MQNFLNNSDVTINLERLQGEFVEKETELRAHFEAKIDEIKRKCAEDLSHSQADVKIRLKKEYGKQRNEQKIQNAKRINPWIPSHRIAIREI